MPRPIFYDTETTGTRAEKDFVIELAAFDPVNQKTFDQLIKPEAPIPLEATQIHNISNEMVENSPKFSEIIDSFIQFCEGDVVLIAHNNDQFDVLFLRAEFKRAKRDMPAWRFFDTLKWARRYRSDLPKHSLQFLREIYQIPPNDAHRALNDVMILHQVFQAMTDDLDLDQIFRLLHQPKQIRKMPFGKYQGKPLKEVPKDYIAWLQQSGAFEKTDNQELKKSFIELGLY